METPLMEDGCFMDHEFPHGMPGQPYDLYPIHAPGPHAIYYPEFIPYDSRGNMPCPGCLECCSDRPLFIIVPEKYLKPETLDYYGLSWEYDKYKRDHIVIKQHIDLDFQAILFAHSCGLIMGSKLVKSTKSGSRREVRDAPPSRQPTRSPAPSKQSRSTVNEGPFGQGGATTEDKDEFLRLCDEVRTLKETLKYARSVGIDEEAEMLKGHIAEARAATTAAMYGIIVDRGWRLGERPEGSYRYRRECASTSPQPPVNDAGAAESSGAAAARAMRENKQKPHSLNSAFTKSRPLEGISVTNNLREDIRVLVHCQEIHGTKKYKLSICPAVQELALAEAQGVSSGTLGVTEPACSHDVAMSENAKSENVPNENEKGKSKGKAKPLEYEDSVPSSTKVHPDVQHNGKGEVEAVEINVEDERKGNASPTPLETENDAASSMKSDETLILTPSPSPSVDTEHAAHAGKDGVGWGIQTQLDSICEW